MDYDDLWPGCSHQSRLLLTQTKSQLTVCHINPAERVKTGPGSAPVTALAFRPCSQRSCRGGGSESDVWWLSNWQETLLSPGLSGCLQRRWREQRRTERPFLWHSEQLWPVSRRCSHNRIKATSKLASSCRSKWDFSPKAACITGQDGDSMCQTVPHHPGFLPSSLRSTFRFFFSSSHSFSSPVPPRPHCPAGLVALCSTWFQT